MSPTSFVPLTRRYRQMAAYTGFILALVGVYLLGPLLALLAWPEESALAPAFLWPGGAMSLGGWLIWRLCRLKTHVALTTREGGVIVLAGWTAAGLASAWPFAAAQGLTFSQAVFESVSGWTTTGLSVVDVTAAPHCILLWRSMLQYAGGCGLAIIMLAAIAGPAGTGISGAEGRRDQLAPHVRSSAKLVLSMYSLYGLAGSLAYRLAGMSWFDAVNHAFCAIATGGFSTHPDSIGHFNSPLIEAISLGLMTIGNLNFLTAYLLWTGRLKAVWRNLEIRVFLVALSAAVGLLLVLVCAHIYPETGRQLRVALFEAASALTGTGFSITTYDRWPPLGHLILIGLMTLGGGTCSTSGGLKQYRVGLLWLGLYWQVRRTLLPRRAVMAMRIFFAEDYLYINAARLQEAGLFLFIYLLTLLTGAAVLMAHGFGFMDSLFEYASTLGTVGLSVGLTKASNPPLVLWTQTGGMFLGRLEFFVIFVALAKLTRDGVQIIFGSKNK